jgi:hypothetical protein
MNKAIAIIGIIVATWTITSIAQEKTPLPEDNNGVSHIALIPPPACPPCIPDETQRLKLENKQLKAALAIDKFNAARAEWNTAEAAFRSECDAIKKENNWPEDVTCDLQTMKFTLKETKSGPAPDAKPAKP